MIWTIEHNGHAVPIQYDLRENPWAVLVACTLLRRSGGHQVKPVLDWWLKDVPTARHAVQRGVDLLAEDFNPVGLARAKATAVVGLSWQWMDHLSSQLRQPSVFELARWRHVGPYLAQSYHIFVERGKVRALQCTDHVLVAWQSSPNGMHFRNWGMLPPRKES